MMSNNIHNNNPNDDYEDGGSEVDLQVVDINNNNNNTGDSNNVSNGHASTSTHDDTGNNISSLQQDVHSLPTVAEITGKRVRPMDVGDPDEDSPWGDAYDEELGGGLPLITFTCLFLVLIALSVGLGVGLSQRHKRINAEYRRDARFRDVVNFAGNHSISTWSSLMTDGSPQNSAANWLAHVDPMNMEVPMSSLESTEGYDFATRYILAVVYYAMGGDSEMSKSSANQYTTPSVDDETYGWEKSLNFLTGDHICTWYEVIVQEYSMFPRGVGCDKNFIDALFLDSNNVIGKIPSELGFLTTLRVINFDLNSIRGGIPYSMRKLSDLEHASIAHNLLTGDFPTWIHRLVNLETLDLSYNFIGGTLPTQLSEMQSLVALALDNNGISGTIHNIFGSYSTANNGMEEDYILDPITGFQWGLTSMEALYLEDNNFTGVMDDSFLYGMANMRRLDLSGNHFNGTLPNHFFQWTSLQVLDLHGNKLQGNLPVTIPKNENLEFLALHQNTISGSISSSISNLSKLTHLDLSQNFLTSTIPTEIGELSELSYLFLSKNKFESGPIPTAIGLLTNLKDLSMKSTNRNGQLPSEVFNHDALSRLVLLDLDDNDLTGQIPPSLGSLINLQFLLLNGNALNGTIPVEFANLLNLRLFFIDENEVRGDMGVFCNRPENYFLPYIIADCGQPVIEISCDCCFKCCSNINLCNDNDIIPSHDPMWQFGYERIFYVFGERTAFFAYP